MPYHNWSMRTERDQKKQYISLCRKIVKCMVRDMWIEKPDPGCSWDHSLSCQIANLSHLSLRVVNSPHNLKQMEFKANNRKGVRVYLPVEQLINEYNNWDKRLEWEEWLKSLEIKWNVNFGELIKPIIV